MAEPGFVYCANQDYLAEFTNKRILFCCVTAQNDDDDDVHFLKSCSKSKRLSLQFKTNFPVLLWAEEQAHADLDRSVYSVRESSIELTPVPYRYHLHRV